jgi:hypothetical protein
MSTDRHLTKGEVDAIADELLAAEHARPGALPPTPEDQAALERIRVAVLAEAAKPRPSWWRRWL